MEEESRKFEPLGSTCLLLLIFSGPSNGLHTFLLPSFWAKLQGAAVSHPGTNEEHAVDVVPV